VYTSLSLVALLKFGTGLEASILANVSHMKEGWLPIVIDVVFLLIIMMHLPIVLFVGKEALLIIVDEALRKSYSVRPRPTIDDAYNLRGKIKINSLQSSQTISFILTSYHYSFLGLMYLISNF